MVYNLLMACIGYTPCLTRRAGSEATARRTNQTDGGKQMKWLVVMLIVGGCATMEAEYICPDGTYSYFKGSGLRVIPMMLNCDD